MLFAIVYLDFFDIFTFVGERILDNLKLFKLVADALSKAKTSQADSGNGKNPFDFSKILQNLGGFSGKNNTDSPTDNGDSNDKKEAISPLPSAPLQAGMLGTMKSHDEFIKRVMEKNKKC